MRRISMKDIASLCGISRTVVSRVLNNKASRYRISEDTKNKILKIAKKLNYQPNQLALALKLGRTNTIGLIVSDITNPFFSTIAKCIENCLNQMGYSLIICNSDEKHEKEKGYLSLLRQKKVDGIIISPTQNSSHDIKKLLQERYPFVLIDRCIPGIKTNCVVVDNKKGAYDLTKYLIDRGHCFVAHIAGIKGTYTTSERLEGYKQALKESRLRYEERLVIHTDFSIAKGYKAARDLLSQKIKKPTAIFCANNKLTVGALQVVLNMKLKIPDDVEIVGFDEIEMCRLFQFPFAFIQQPAEEIGRKAVEILLGQLKNKKMPKLKKQYLRQN